MPTLLKDTHGITEPRMTAVPPTMASRASGAFGDMAGRSSTRSCHPGAGTATKDPAASREEPPIQQVQAASREED